jgi:hypothetical protein
MTFWFALNASSQGELIRARIKKQGAPLRRVTLPEIFLSSSCKSAPHAGSARGALVS